MMTSAGVKGMIEKNPRQRILGKPLRQYINSAPPLYLGQSIQEQSKFCGRQSLKNLLSPLLNTLSHLPSGPDEVTLRILFIFI